MTYPKKVPYGTSPSFLSIHATSLLNDRAVRLGNSGLKVSKIILGCMSYGSPGVYFAMYLLN